MDSGLLNEFLIESFENLSEIDSKLTVIEDNPEDKELLNALYRVVHTMKGSASFLGLVHLQKITHSTENLLDLVRNDEIKINSQIVDTLLKTFDVCRKILKNLESNGEEGSIDSDTVTKSVEDLVHSKASQEEVSQSENEVSFEEALEEELNDLDERDLSSSNKKEEIEDENEDDELDSLINEHKGDILSSNPFDELKDEDYSPSADDEKAKAPGKIEINDAAMESLRELMDDGAIDADIMKELSNSSATRMPILKEEPVSLESSELEAVTKNEDIEPVAQKKFHLPATSKEEPSREVKKPLDIKSPISEKDPVGTAKAVKAKAPVQAERKNVGESATSLMKQSLSDSIVRVNVKTLDKIMNIVGELVLNRNQILQCSEEFRNNSSMGKLTQQLNVITSDLQREVMTTRMQPIGTVLSKFERLVRDYSRENSKKIKLKLVGQETELDKTLIEAIKDPLVHIVRNAIDHGMESVDERKQAGKPELGTLEIKAYNEGGLVTIEVSDDGRGINTERVLEKAVERGLVAPDEAKKLTPNQIHQFIFHSGFSTAEQVTNISGRGVGMDVVRTNIESINGVINIESEYGKGTIFKMKIPLTLAIVPALIVRSGSEFFAIPQLNLVELVRIDEKSSEQVIEKIHDYEFLKLRGALNPLVRLDKVLNFIKVEDGTQLEETENIVILNSENVNFGVVVDEILDTVEIVVKPLSNNLKKLSIYGGATIMGNGHVALILDVSGILQKFLNQVEQEQTRINSANQLDSNGVFRDFHENIIFSLYNGRDFAIPLTLVHRLEEFEKKSIELVGNSRIVRYLDRSMPIIEVEKALEITNHDYLEQIGEDERVQCIVVKNKENYFGFIVKKIVDIDRSESEVEADLIQHPGLMGVYHNGNKTINVLNVYSLISEYVKNKIVDPAIEGSQTEIKKKQLKALVVDDSSMYRKLQEQVMDELGFEVVTAVHGEDALDKLEMHQFDFVLTDIEMPYCNGFELAKKIREHQKHAQVPILAMSTKNTEDFRKKGEESGINKYLEKFEKEELITEVQNLLKVA